MDGVCMCERETERVYGCVLTVKLKQAKVNKHRGGC